jgi:hypothetical protein
MDYSDPRTEVERAFERFHNLRPAELEALREHYRKQLEELTGWDSLSELTDKDIETLLERSIARTRKFVAWSVCRVLHRAHGHGIDLDPEQALREEKFDVARAVWRLYEETDGIPSRKAALKFAVDQRGCTYRNVLDHFQNAGMPTESKPEEKAVVTVETARCILELNRLVKRDHFTEIDE